MVSSEKLLQATLNRLSMRLGKKLIVSINELTEVIKTAPEKVRNEWEIFQEEVFEEAERLEKDSTQEASGTKDSELTTTQKKIEQIRQKIEKLSNKIEANN